jgi:hypothetical protein
MTTEALVDLHRLIARTDAQLLQRIDSKSGKLKLQGAVAKMDELLELLEKTAPPEQVAKQQRAVERFHALLRSSSGHVAVSSAIRLAVAGGSDLSAEQRTAHVGASARMMATERAQAREELLEEDDESGEEAKPKRVAWSSFASAKAQLLGGAGGDNDAARTEELIAYHREEQERLAEDMLAGSVLIKSAASAIEATLKSDTERLKELNTVSGDNSISLAKERDRIKQQVSRTCSFTLVTIAVCVVVLIVFVWMVFLIRLSGKSR